MDTSALRADLATSAAAPKTQPQPFMMVPLRRCGSHAVRLRLNMSPNFYSPYPLHLVDFMPLIDLYGDLGDDETYFRLVVDLIGLQNSSMVRWDHVSLDPVTVFEALAKKPRSVHAVVWQMLIAATRQHGADVVMDKSLDSVRYAENCLELHPDLRFLNLVRDPRAQVSSMNRAIIYDFDTVLNALRWVEAHDIAQALVAKHPDRVLTIRFEDFVADPAPALERICEFVGITYSDRMLEISDVEEARRLASRSALWEENDKALTTGNIAKYVQQLTADEIRLIESLTAGHMARYGYARTTDGQLQVTPQVIAAARTRSVTASRRAWQRLHDEDPQDYQLRQYRAWYLQTLRERLTSPNLAPDRRVVPPPATARSGPTSGPVGAW